MATTIRTTIKPTVPRRGLSQRRRRKIRVNGATPAHILLPVDHSGKDGAVGLLNVT